MTQTLLTDWHLPAPARTLQEHQPPAADSDNTLGRLLLAAAGFFPKRYQALKPRATAEAAHTVSAIKKGTKREVRRDIVA